MKTSKNIPGPVILIAFGVILVAAAGFLLLFNPAGALAPVSGPPRIGYPLGNFTLIDLNGARVSLADYRGRPVLINAWATWCPPCEAEMPALNAYYESHKNQGLALLAINVGETRQQAADFAQKYRLTFQILLDADQSLMDTMQIFDYPTSILVGKDGLVKAIHVGKLTPETIEKEMSPFLGTSQ